MKFVTKSCLIFTLAVLMMPGPAFAKKARRRPASEGGGEQAALGKIWEAESERTWNSPVLKQSLHHSSVKVVKSAMLALGRIGDTTAIKEISEILNRKSTDLAKTAAFSLGLIGGEGALRVLNQQLQMRSESDVLGTLLTAIGRAGKEENVKTLARYVGQAADEKIAEGACHGLGLLFSGDSEKWEVPTSLLPDLLLRASGESSAALYCAFAMARYKGNLATLPIGPFLEAVAKSKLVHGRAFLLRVVGKTKGAASAGLLARELTSSPHLGIRIEAARALADQDPTPEVLEALGKGVAHSKSAVAVASLETVASFSFAADKLGPAVETVLKTTKSEWVKGKSLQTLAKIQPLTARNHVNQFLKSSSTVEVAYAAGALAYLGGAEDFEQIASLVRHVNPRVAEEAIESLNGIPEEKIPDSVKVSLRNILLNTDVATTSLVAQLVEKYKWREFAAPLSTVYRLFQQRDQLEAKVGILNALAAVGDHSVNDTLTYALNDPDRAVVVAAVAAIKAVTKKDESAKIPANSKSSAPSLTAKEIASAPGTKLTFTTARGSFTMKLLDAAPITSAQILRLIRQKDGESFKGYQGTTFHRVVPNFVAQGGDPRGDGFGGPGFLIRDEVGQTKHSRATVGIATAGKDTGGCQFFVNLSPNPHLDGRYTLFAEVTQGMDVVDRLEAGDAIEKVTVGGRGEEAITRTTKTN